MSWGRRTRQPPSVARQRGPWAWAMLCIALLAPALWPAAAPAHDMAGEVRVNAFARQEEGRWVLLLRLPLQLLLGVDLPQHGNGYLDLERVGDALPRALAATRKSIVFGVDGQALAPVAVAGRVALPGDRSFESFERAAAGLAGPPLPASTQVFWNQGYLDLRLEYPRPGGASPSSMGDPFIDFKVAPGMGERVRLDLRLLLPDGRVRAFDIATGTGRVALDPRWFQAAGTFTSLGTQHILGGLDHLLFLLCLVLPFRRVGWPLVGVVTAFTLGHSVSLLGAGLGLVPSNPGFPPLMEWLIAGSILYMAVENLLRPRLQRRWWTAALFGVVHGFGFSFALSHELQFAGSHLVASLLAFNVGIELGQLAVLLALWPLLRWLHTRRAADERVLTIGVGAFAAHTAWHWLAERWQAVRELSWPELQAGSVPVAVWAGVAGLALGLWLLRRGRGPASAPPPEGRRAGAMAAVEHGGEVGRAGEAAFARHLGDLQ